MMKKLVLFILFMSAVPFAAHAEFGWTGSASSRYLVRKNDDGLSTKDAAGHDSSQSTKKDIQMRADLNASSKGESLDWGVGVRTNSGNPTSEWVNVQNNGDFAIGLMNAYFRYHGDVLGGEGAVTVGRTKTVLLYDPVAQTLFDNDVRWDGLGWSWKKDGFGLNLAQYVLGARNSGTFGASTYSTTESSDAVASTQGGFGALYSIQPFATFKLTDDIQALVAVGYHMWPGVGGSTTYENQVHGGTKGTVGNTDSVVLDNARQWQVYTDWTLPMNFRFVAEYVRNKKVNYGTRLAGGHTDKETDHDAYALSLAYGKVKNAMDWSLSYSYANKGIGSVMNAYTNGNMSADNTGHLVEAKFMPAQNLTVAAKVELYREKAKLGGDGVALAAPNQNRRQTQNRFELATGLSF